MVVFILPHCNRKQRQASLDIESSFLHIASSSCSCFAPLLLASWCITGGIALPQIRPSIPLRWWPMTKNATSKVVIVSVDHRGLVPSFQPERRVSTNQNPRSIGLRTATGEKDTAHAKILHRRSRRTFLARAQSHRSTWYNTIDDVVSMLGMNRHKCSRVVFMDDTSFLSLRTI